jgi:hypothetical protein
MYHLKRSMLAGLAVLALGLSLYTAAADEAKPKTATTALDGPKLGQMLDDMGYDAKKVNDTTYDIVLKRDGWTIYLRAFFSTDGTRLYLHSNLADIDDMTKVPPEVFVKLMEANGIHGPSFFYLSSDAKKPGMRYLQVARPLDNRCIAPKQLRTEIDALSTQIKNTKSLWSPAEWSKLQPATPAANDNSVRKDTSVR